MKLTVTRRTKDIVITLQVPWKRRRRVVSAAAREHISAALLAHHAERRAEAARVDSADAPEAA